VTQPTLVARNVELHAEMSEGLPPIDADADQLQQVFINLINNSLDAMPLGGMLKVSTALERDSVVIVLADSGEGIAEDQLDMIFDPLFSTKHGRGTGLGLTIVKQIISEHNGEVEVESDPGEQTAFRIKLPLHSARTTHAAADVAHNAVKSTDNAPGDEAVEQGELAVTGSASVDQ
jgi:signal transduction histidine kinase